MLTKSVKHKQGFYAPQDGARKWRRHLTSFELSGDKDVQGLLLLN